MNQSIQVLVVEDDLGIRGMLTDFLNDEGFSVICKSTGGEALSELSYHSFDVVLLDLGLPDMSGNDVLRQMSHKGKDVPVIVVSANSSQLIPSPQVKAVVPKPFDLEDLLTTIRQNV